MKTMTDADIRRDAYFLVSLILTAWVSEQEYRDRHPGLTEDDYKRLHNIYDSVAEELFNKKDERLEFS